MWRFENSVLEKIPTELFNAVYLVICAHLKILPSELYHRVRILKILLSPSPLRCCRSIIKSGYWPLEGFNPFILNSDIVGKLGGQIEHDSVKNPFQAIEKEALDIHPQSPSYVRGSPRKYLLKKLLGAFAAQYLILAATTSYNHNLSSNLLKRYEQLSLAYFCEIRKSGFKTVGPLQDPEEIICFRNRRKQYISLLMQKIRFPLFC